jgi:hypothetical protein
MAPAVSTMAAASPTSLLACAPDITVAECPSTQGTASLNCKVGNVSALSPILVRRAGIWITPVTAHRTTAATRTAARASGGLLCYQCKVQGIAWYEIARARGMEAIPVLDGWVNRRFVFDGDVGSPELKVTIAIPTLSSTGT